MQDARHTIIEFQHVTNQSALIGTFDAFNRCFELSTLSTATVEFTFVTAYLVKAY